MLAHLTLLSIKQPLSQQLIHLYYIKAGLISEYIYIFFHATSNEKLVAQNALITAPNQSLLM